MSKLRWDKTFERLKTYKDKHGNVDVPYRYNDDIRGPHLGHWVYQQRARKAKLTKDQRRRLLELGFDFGNADNKRWERTFQELGAYYSKNCNCLVPAKCDGVHDSLGRWVVYQRDKYKKGILAQNRIEKLNSIGFTWELRPRSSGSNAVAAAVPSREEEKQRDPEKTSFDDDDDDDEEKDDEEEHTVLSSEDQARDAGSKAALRRPRRKTHTVQPRRGKNWDDSSDADDTDNQGHTDYEDDEEDSNGEEPSLPVAKKKTKDGSSDQMDEADNDARRLKAPGKAQTGRSSGNNRRPAKRIAETHFESDSNDGRDNGAAVPDSSGQERDIDLKDFEDMAKRLSEQLQREAESNQKEALQDTLGQLQEQLKEYRSSTNRGSHVLWVEKAHNAAKRKTGDEESPSETARKRSRTDPSPHHVEAPRPVVEECARGGGAVLEDADVARRTVAKNAPNDHALSSKGGEPADKENAEEGSHQRESEDEDSLESDSSSQDEGFRSLPVEIKDDEIALMRTGLAGDTEWKKVVSFGENHHWKDFVCASGETVGGTYRAFHVPKGAENVEYSGETLRLPPNGGKMVEDYHLRRFARMLTVIRGDPKELELQVLYKKNCYTFWLSPGDLIHIPPYNRFRLTNMSKSKECVLTSVTIGPTKGRRSVWPENWPEDEWSRLSEEK